MDTQPDRPDMARGDEAPPEEPVAGPMPCPACDGSGKRNGERCELCGGTGRVEEAVGGG